jgi:hypothetical protein
MVESANLLPKRDTISKNGFGKNLFPVNPVEGICRRSAKEAAASGKGFLVRVGALPKK